MINDSNLKAFWEWEQILFTEGNGVDIDDQYLKYDKVIVSDCDGILTDGGHYYTEDGKLMKKFGSCDKDAMRFMKKCGWKFIFVTDDPTGYNITLSRMNDWGIDCVNYEDFIGIGDEDNIAAMALKEEFKNKSMYNIFIPVVSAKDRVNIVEALKRNNMYVVFLGDSVSDISAGLKADMFATTFNALPLVKTNADIVSQRDGGSSGFADLMYNIHYAAGSKYSGIAKSKLQTA